MHLRLTYWALAVSAAYLALALGPDVYEILALSAAPDEWCELVETGGHFKVAACSCECRLLWRFPLSMAGVVMGGGALVGLITDFCWPKIRRH